MAQGGKGFGRLRFASLRSGKTATFETIFKAHIAAGSRLSTDDWSSYAAAAKNARLEHFATSVSRSEHKAHELLPGSHRVFSLLHRVLLTTYQGAVSMKHLPAYLGEFEFRFNRRHSLSRGLLLQSVLTCAVAGAPPTYRDCTSGPRAYKRTMKKEPEPVVS